MSIYIMLRMYLLIVMFFSYIFEENIMRKLILEYLKTMVHEAHSSLLRKVVYDQTAIVLKPHLQELHCQKCFLLALFYSIFM